MTRESTTGYNFLGGKSMNLKELFPVLGNVCTYVLTAIQSNEVLQVIEFIFSLILTLVILLYRVWHWWKEAKKDGKIDEKEIDELGKIIEDTKKEVDGHEDGLDE